MTALLTGEQELDQVRRVILDALRQTSLAYDMDRFGSSVGGGKMLRARLVLEVGKATAVAPDVLYRLGAVSELLHAASLLHDDIIDGGIERRGATALWVSEGMKAAVLIGDLMLSVALGLVQEAGPARLPILIDALRDMCDAEAEQEFSSGQDHDSWEDCVRIARCKTGSLFGLTAAFAGGADDALVIALEHAGRDLGTAYQLADDLLDACPDPSVTGKSLGTDAATGKLTAATVSSVVGPDPAAAISELLASSEASLSAWPEVQQRWRAYVDNVLEPLIHSFTQLSQIAMP